MPDIDLDGTEYKCLPSGLHSVEEDLVYFVHGNCAGVSAFVREEADESHRNADFVAVGGLVPLSYGRLGKSWLHAAELRRLAKEIVRNGDDKRALELYWKQHGQAGHDDVESASPSMTRSLSPADSRRKRKRARSDTPAPFSSDGGIPPDHPALAVNDLLDSFGPLIFPLYRAALLRRRILLLGAAPVQQRCKFVYLLSILSGIPEELHDVIQPTSVDLLRIQTLFNVGIHDIPFLSDSKRKERWLACTTDDILGEKKDLYDLLVTFPNLTLQMNDSKRRPTLRTSDGHIIKATQRDLRRYGLLRAELDRLQSVSTRYRDDPGTTGHTDDEEATSLMRASTVNLLQEVKRGEANETEVVEPVSWTAMAYNGFMWWASAGEMEAWENEETKTDRQLLNDLPEMDALLPQPGDNNDHDNSPLPIQAFATLVAAYFHRLSAQIVQPLADLVEEADDETDEGIADLAITVSSDDVRAMGLDSWSSADLAFVTRMMEVYFGREATVDLGGTRICGVQIC